MHLLEAPAFAFDIDEHWRIDAGHARGRHQHIAKQVERFGCAARRDRAHVPHGGALRVEVGGDDEEPAAFLVFDADALEQRVIDIARDQALERLGLEHARAENRRQPVDLQQFLADAFGEQVLEHGVIRRTEEREWRDQRACAGAGHDPEFGPLAALGPAGEQAGAIGAIRAAAGDRQHIHGAAAVGKNFGARARQQRVGAIVRPYPRVRECQARSRPPAVPW